MLSVRPQSGGSDPGGDRQAGPTKCSFTTFPRKERQGENRGLEVGPH